MQLIERYVWILFIVVTIANGRSWWSRVQDRIRADPALEPGYRRLYGGYLFWLNLPWLGMGLGILGGQVQSIFDFMRPGDGNPFVLGWWGILAAVLVAGTWWIMAGGGAELLERHPGVYMVPQWPASKLRFAWLAFAAWNVTIASMLFAGFADAAPPAGPLSAPGTWVFPVIVLILVVFTVGSSFLFSSMSGWDALADQYAARGPASGERFRFRSGRIGGQISYSRCLNFTAGPAGLSLSVMFLFRPGHPPLHIPWADIEAQEVASWLSQAVDLRFAKVRGSSLQLSRRRARRLFEASGQHIQVQPSA